MRFLSASNTCMLKCSKTFNELIARAELNAFVLLMALSITFRKWGGGHLISSYRKEVRRNCELSPNFELKILHVYQFHNSAYIDSSVLKPHMITLSNKTFPCYWPFVRVLHRSPVNSSHKDQWRGALMFSLICAWTNRWVNNGHAGDLRRHRFLYHVIAAYQVSGGDNLWK